LIILIKKTSTGMYFLHVTFHTWIYRDTIKIRDFEDLRRTAVLGFPFKWPGGKSILIFFYWLFLYVFLRQRYKAWTIPLTLVGNVVHAPSRVCNGIFLHDIFPWIQKSQQISRTCAAWLQFLIRWGQIHS
jgi:hypothetical protein